MPVIRVQIPKMGMSTVEVEIADLVVSVGDVVSPGDALFEVETEKVTTVIPSEVSGVVEEVLVTVGQECQVGDAVLRIRLDE